MAENPLIPSVMAYSGVSNPLKIYNANDTAVWNQGAGLGNFSSSKTLNITEYGIIQGALATVNVLTTSALGAPTLGQVLTILYRNGRIIFSSSTDLPNLNTYNGGKGQVVYETFGFLSGAEVYPGETFVISIESGDYSQRTSQIMYTINLVVKSQGRQFTI